MEKGIFTFKKPFFLTNNETHWSSVYINFSNGTIEYLDSLNGRGSKEIDFVLDNLHKEWKTLCNDTRCALALKPNDKFPPLKRIKSRTLPRQ